MRFASFTAIVAAILPTSALAQEQTGSQGSAQTSAAIIGIDRPQPPSCGAAPNVAQINKLIPLVRGKFPQPGGFNAGLTTEIRKSCPRNSVAAYLIRTIAANNWVFVAPYPPHLPSWPMGTIACGVAAGSADLNAVIGKVRPLVTDQAAFNAAINYIGKQPCVSVRATLYLFGLILDNGLTFRR